MGALTQRQQEALDGWLKDGGVAIVGGGAKAAENFGFFEKYTGISAGTVGSGGDITGELLETFGVGGHAAWSGSHDRFRWKAEAASRWAAPRWQT